MYFEKEQDFIHQFLEMPSAPTVLEKMKHALELEKQNRKKFYADIDDDMKAEFINGDIIIHSPVKKEHTDSTYNITQLLKTYTFIHDLGYVGYEKVLSSFTRNDYEPDVVFFNKEKSKAFKKGMWKFPVPDLIVEVLSKSTEARDRGVKYTDYEAHSVLEYWIVDADNESIEQYILKNNKYILQFKANKGQIESYVISGFKAEVKAFFNEKLCLAELKKMM